MKVGLELMVPDLPKVTGKKRLEVEFEGETMADLLVHLGDKYGQRAKDALYDDEGVLDPVIQFVVNGKAWIQHDKLDMELKEGDQVLILALLAGG